MKKQLTDRLLFRDLLEGERNPSSLFSALPPLETERLILRRIRMRDTGDLFSWSSDPEVARYVLWDAHTSRVDTRSYIRYVRSLYRQGLPSSWGMELKENGKVIGTIGFMWYSSVNRSAEIGYSLSREYWNRGLMTEAVSRVLDFGFDELRLHRAEAQADVRNPASARVLEKCGMRREGILRGRIFNKGEFVDVSLYAVLSADREAAASAAVSGSPV